MFERQLDDVAARLKSPNRRRRHFRRGRQVFPFVAGVAPGPAVTEIGLDRDFEGDSLAAEPCDQFALLARLDAAEQFVMNLQHRRNAGAPGREQPQLGMDRA